MSTISRPAFSFCICHRHHRQGTEWAHHLLGRQHPGTQTGKKEKRETTSNFVFMYVM